jgi:hypothetical protein
MLQDNHTASKEFVFHGILMHPGGLFAVAPLLFAACCCR